ncbi:SAM-dependent methyltransferase [Nonomuraea wenchangensis]|uniref:S-adenosyl methyltransferase n=1 Tax=Nonomuraea wenchangensis TaxID=568860 RepID=A0A1I0LL85_9ACTN|nr:SAM-dependent methyltransferase [Nonomuraea wenchangensis]SEU41466.1 S-adenosyl methyltransferase [Nonomuraea wenchangensis]
MRQRAIRNLAKLEMTQASATRILDAAAGGKNNFVADRDAMRRYDIAAPITTKAARAVLHHVRRVVRWLAAERVEQFVIVGSGVPSGLPAGRQLHDVAREALPGGRPRVVYVENDPMVLAGARATIEPVTDLVRVVEGDVRDIDEVLDDHVMRTFLDWDRPVAVLLLSTHSLNDEEYFHYVIKRVRQAVPEGSFLSLLQTTFDAVPPELLPAIHDLLAMTLPGHAIRAREEVAALLDGLELVDPGLVWVPEWRPDGHDAGGLDDPSASGTYGAVARVP